MLESIPFGITRNLIIILVILLVTTILLYMWYTGSLQEITRGLGYVRSMGG